MAGSRSRIASYSASVWPPGTPNTCRTPCSASRPASSAPPWPFWPGGTTPRNPPLACGPCDSVAGALPCWPGGATPRNPPLACGPCDSVAGALPCWPGGTTPRNPPLACGPCDSVAGALPCWPGGTGGPSGTGSPEQPGGGAAEDGLLVRAEAKRADLADGVVGAHVERAVRAEQHLPGARVADQVREQALVVGDGVVVEPAQCRVRAAREPGPGLRADGEGTPQPPADHRQRAAAVREHHPQPGAALQHPGHGHVRGRDRGLHRVPHRVPQVVLLQRGDAEPARG